MAARYVRRGTNGRWGDARQTRGRSAPMLAVMRFLFGTDGSPGARIALDFLCALPLSNADHVCVVTVPVYSFIGTGVVPEGPDLLHDRGLDAARAIGERARAALASH